MSFVEMQNSLLRLFRTDLNTTVEDQLTHFDQASLDRPGLPSFIKFLAGWDLFVL
jgi:uncharacterized protein YacL (UPF0231 family)